MHARGLAGDLGSAAKRAADRRGKFFARTKFGFSFHCDLSNTFGVRLKVSYTLQTSAKRRDEGADLLMVSGDSSYGALRTQDEEMDLGKDKGRDGKSAVQKFNDG